VEYFHLASTAAAFIIGGHPQPVFGGTGSGKDSANAVLYRRCRINCGFHLQYLQAPDRIQKRATDKKCFSESGKQHQKGAATPTCLPGTGGLASPEFFARFDNAFTIYSQNVLFRARNCEMIQAWSKDDRTACQSFGQRYREPSYFESARMVGQL
jgi:hypothetical protein